MNKECQTCGGPIDTSKSTPRQALKRMYCSSSCSARMNGVVFPKRGSRHINSIVEKLPNGGYKYCLECRQSIGGVQSLAFCCPVCRERFWDTVSQHIARREKGRCSDCGTTIAIQSVRCRDCHVKNRTNTAIKSWLDGEWSGSQEKNDYILSTTVRSYLLAEADYACQNCGYSTRHPVDNLPILEINHINGVSNDHRRENLEVLCPNCHSLTPNFGHRNAGNGRPRIWAWDVL